MSLSRFVKQADVKVQLKHLRPKLPRKIDVKLKVELRSPRYLVVGTAFDYLLRFELQRCAPHAVTRSWTAELAPDCIWKRNDKGSSFRNLSQDEAGVISFTPAPGEDVYAQEFLARQVAERLRRVVEQARLAHTAYLNSMAPTRAEQAELAAHAIRLAKLDDIPRGDRFDSTFEQADAEDVEELIALLAIAPVATLLHDQTLLLNPTFGESSLLVGGADADLITGDALIDFKTTKGGEVTAEQLDQLLGYFLLARNFHRTNPTFPAIHRLGLYFCRHGHLWMQDASVWTEHPRFAAIEEWFLSRAKERPALVRGEVAERPE